MVIGRRRLDHRQPIDAKSQKLQTHRPASTTLLVMPSVTCPTTHVSDGDDLADCRQSSDFGEPSTSKKCLLLDGTRHGGDVVLDEKRIENDERQ